MPPGIDLELLPQRQLDERLVLATAEQGKEATKDRQRENDQRPHTDLILR
jgi:hypothetical protein